MKKVVSLCFIICLLGALLVGCVNKPANPKNGITPKALTQEQKEIIELLSIDKQEILLFDYKTVDDYKNVEFWVEVYKDGVLVDRPSGADSFSDEARPLDGQLAVLINQNPDFVWTFGTKENGTKVSHTSQPNTNYAQSGRAFGPIDQPVTIEDGKEIVLYTSIFTDGAISTYDDHQIYIEQPELLKEYPFVHIIKCKFTK